MNNKTLLICFLVMALFQISCGFEINKNSGGVKEISYDIICEQISDTYLRSSCFEDLAVLSNNISYCDNDFCITTVATLNSNSEFCEFISSEKQKGTCYAWVGRSKTNIGDCKKILSNLGKNSCYINVAAIKENKLFCEEVFEIEVSWGTIFDTLGIGPPNHPSGASVLKETPTFKDMCLFAIAREKSRKGDASECKLVTNNHLNDLCFSSFNFSAVKSEEDCEYVSGYYKDECYRSLAKKFSEHELCGKIENKYTKSDCIIDLAKIHKNVSQCDLMPGIYKKVDCLISVNPSSLKLTFCEEVAGSDKDICFRLISKIIPDACDKITKDSMKAECISDIAEKNLDLKLCDKIKLKGGKEACKRIILKNIAVKNKDSEYCSRIMDRFNTKYKSNCYNELAMLLQDKNLCQFTESPGRCEAELIISTVKAGHISESINECQRINDMRQKDFCLHGIIKSVLEQKNK